ncbi:MAG: acyl--CoA ligase [Ruminococcus flavefaciens]|nr:acyl--CoA ligase [Ruminococcus flavefaciens]MCM1232610.1 acyl--CoA ligase [Ruminococcus flavefaciens]
MKQTILEVLAGYSAQIPEKTAVISEKETLTYADFWKSIRKSAKFLRSSGLKKGGKVVIKAAQNANYLICYYAIQLSGGIPCCLERNTPSATVVQTAEKIHADFVISETNLHTAQLEEHIRFISMKTVRLAEISVNEDSEFAFPSADDTQLIMFTTGTTGASKGVELTFRAMQASEEKIVHFLGMHDYAEDGLFVTPTPLNHAKGIWETGGMLRCGGSVYLLNGMLDLKAYFTALDYPCKKLLLSLVPANLRLLLSMVPDELAKRADKIGAIKLGTAPLLEYEKNRILEILPNTALHNPYGSSEGGILCSYQFDRYPGLEFCIGKPLLHTEVIVVDDERNPINSSANNMGTLAFRSNSLMKGYYGEPELTASIMQDGVIYTNDYGYIDENGFVYVRGRADDVINVGGLKVAPDEVEAEAIALDGVEDCICIASEDEFTGSGLKLLLVMKEKGTLDSSAIRKKLSAKLEAYKIPKQCEEVDEIARMYNGKLNRKAYRI